MQEYCRFCVGSIGHCVDWAFETVSQTVKKDERGEQDDVSECALTPWKLMSCFIIMWFNGSWIWLWNSHNLIIRMQETVQGNRRWDIILLSSFDVPLEMLLRVSCSCQTIPSFRESPLCARISSFSCVTSVFCWYTSMGEDLRKIFFFFQKIKWSGWVFVGVCQPAQIFPLLNNLPYHLVWLSVITEQNKTSLLILIK